jgi:organic radical activating enzyme
MPGQIKRLEKQLNGVRGRRIKRVKVVGGEPTMNPHLPKLTAMLDRLTGKAIGGYFIQTNGILPRHSGPKWRVERKSKKSHQEWRISPYDLGIRINFDHFRCSVNDICGTSFDRYGWTPCGRAHAIILMLNRPEIYKKDFPRNKMWCMEAICSHCTIAVPKDVRHVLETQIKEPTKSFRGDPLRTKLEVW